MSHDPHSLKKDAGIVEYDPTDPTDPSDSEFDVLIVGAGVIGSSVAWQLAEQGMGQIAVIDPDLQGTFSSSELNAGAVRATFTVQANIELSKISIEFFDRHKEELGYRACGYHWLIANQKEAEFEARARQCEKFAWPVEIWNNSKLAQELPFIDKTSDLLGAMVARRDGLINPNRLKEYYRAQARARGVKFIDRAWLETSEYRNSKWNSKVRVQTRGLGAPALKVALEQKGEYEGAEQCIRSKVLVNCAGPWAGEVAKRMGYQTPTRAVRRQVCVFSSRGLAERNFGMIVDTSGVYFHPEATHILAGFANHHEKPGFSFEYDGDRFFQEQIWAPLYERSTHFENLKHVTGWAGLYEVSPDESAIIGKVKDGLYDCHSFSGHGVMHSYAAAKVLSELIITGRYQTIDASVYSAQRFATQKLLVEGAVI